MTISFSLHDFWYHNVQRIRSFLWRRSHNTKIKSFHLRSIKINFRSSRIYFSLNKLLIRKFCILHIIVDSSTSLFTHNMPSASLVRYVFEAHNIFHITSRPLARASSVYLNVMKAQLSQRKRATSMKEGRKIHSELIEMCSDYKWIFSSFFFPFLSQLSSSSFTISTHFFLHPLHVGALIRTLSYFFKLFVHKFLRCWQREWKINFYHWNWIFNHYIFCGRFEHRKKFLFPSRTRSSCKLIELTQINNANWPH